MKQMFAMRISTRIGVILSVLSCILLGMGGFSIYATSRANDIIRQTHNNDMTSAADIAVIQLGVSRQRLALDRAVLVVGTPEATDRLATLEKRQKQMDEAWHHFQSLPRDDDATKLAESFGNATANMRQAVEKLAAAIRAGEQSSLLDLMRDLTKRYEAMSVSADALNKYQNDLATRRYEESERTYATFRITAIVMIVASLLVALWSYVALRLAIVRPISSVLTSLGNIAAGDLSRQIPAHANDELGQVLDGLRNMQAQLSATVAQVRTSGETIAAATREIAAGNLDLSSRTEEQSASLEETASSMEQLASTVKQNAANARQANQLAANASEVATRGGNAVAEVVSTMNDISSSSKKISEIVSVIDGIAFQTNILALNAAVEAARAGEQGRGFAVVAGEVRTLAQRSAQAAKEIKQLIEDSVSKVGMGAQQVDRAGETMQEIVDSVRRVTNIMSEISSASEEQSSGIDEVNRAITQMDAVTQQNAALVEESAAGASALEEQAGGLMRAVSTFKLAGNSSALPRLYSNLH
jgi:methyl-accepting chemotaxis protein-1 (serine sensor receptor)